MSEEPALKERAAELRRLQPAIERAGRFSGWDLRTVRPRALAPGPPWRYAARVRALAAGAAAALDMGTGGGEALARLRPALPARLVATEEWPVNVAVARRRLAPLGVQVVHMRSCELPFADGAFDLVLNRHEELAPAEVARVLRPGGRAITQQVGRSNWQEVRRDLPRMTDFGDLFGTYRDGFVAAGLQVTAALQHERRVAFAGLGAVVFMLAIAPWSVPNLELERDLAALLALETGCRTPEGIVLTESRFLLVARKPA